MGRACSHERIRWMRFQEDRTVGNDNTVKWRRLSLLPSSQLWPHVKANVRVHEYPDGELAVYWGPHRLADYDAAGVMVQLDLLVALTEPSRVQIPSRLPSRRWITVR